MWDSFVNKFSPFERKSAPVLGNSNQSLVNGNLRSPKQRNKLLSSVDPKHIAKFGKNGTGKEKRNRKSGTNISTKEDEINDKKEKDTRRKSTNLARTSSNTKYNTTEGRKSLCVKISSEGLSESIIIPVERQTSIKVVSSQKSFLSAHESKASNHSLNIYSEETTPKEEFRILLRTAMMLGMGSFVICILLAVLLDLMFMNVANPKSQKTKRDNTKFDIQEGNNFLLLAVVFATISSAISVIGTIFINIFVACVNSQVRRSIAKGNGKVTFNV